MSKKPKDDVDLPTKVVTIALTFAAGWIAQKAIAQLWKKATGDDAPLNTDDPEVSLAQAVAFAAVTGGVAVLARRLAAKQAGRITARFGKAEYQPDITP